MWLNALTKDAVVALKGEDGVNNGEGISEGCYAQEEDEREVDAFEYEEEEERVQTQKTEAKEDFPESVYAPSLVGRETTPQPAPDMDTRQRSMAELPQQVSFKRARRKSLVDVEKQPSFRRSLPSEADSSQSIDNNAAAPGGNSFPTSMQRRSSTNVLAIPEPKYDETGHVRKASPPLPPLHQQQHAGLEDEEAGDRRGSVRPGTGTVHIASRVSSSRGSRPSNSRASTRLRTASKERWVELADSSMGTGQDIVLHLHPSLPGVGHTEYSNWAAPECSPHLMKYNVADYLKDDDGNVTHYIEDEYYDGAAIRAADYWSLKRLGRVLRAGILPDNHALASNVQENLVKIDMLIPSRQVKYDAGGRICKAMRLFGWRWRRNRAAIIIQATYRMHLTKFVKRRLVAERKQRMMEEDFRGMQAREREEKARAEEKARLEEEERQAKQEAELAKLALTDAAAAEEAKLLAEIEDLGRKAIAAEEDEDEDEDDGLGDSPEDQVMRAQMELLKESGMGKAERHQMLALIRKAQDPQAKLSDMERGKLDMIGQMEEAERKRFHFCASLVQSWWRGKITRRHLEEEKARNRAASKKARDSAMQTTLSRVYRGHIARRLVRYTRAHNERQLRLMNVVASEGFTRGAVQRRMESRKKVLDIAVCEVQRVYRGHLGRRRMVSIQNLKWELRMTQAAIVIQRAYLDMLDSQWAKYIKAGNVQFLPGKAATKLRRAAQANDAPTVKPPTLEHYSAAHLKETGRIHLIEDGVPLRDVSPKKAKVAPLPPSMPKAVNIRRRWGLPSGLESYDTTTRNVLELINRLEEVKEEREGARRSVATDTEFDSLTEHEATSDLAGGGAGCGGGGGDDGAGGHDGRRRSSSSRASAGGDRPGSKGSSRGMYGLSKGGGSSALAVKMLKGKAESFDVTEGKSGEDLAE